ncbi:MAG: hypothetical protein MUF48_23950 [Pirellulaceae bacterium]|jgi:predicted Zn-dependent protease|nr:hypothetical protein [Pirellulaceae bacterium]
MGSPCEWTRPRNGFHNDNQFRPARLSRCHYSRGVETFFRSGQELLKAGDYAAAVAELKRVPSSSPLYSAAVQLLGQAEHKLQVQLAEKSFAARDYAAVQCASTIRFTDNTPCVR